MWSECLVVWLQCVALLGAFYTYNNTESKGRRQEGAGRFLNLFSVVRFPNSKCSAAGGGGLNGTCYSEMECRKREGIVAGQCAGGFGVCCLFHASCGQTLGENCTYLTTDVSSSSCQYTICRREPSITLLRLDFDSLVLSPPFTCGKSPSSPTCTTTDGPLIGDCIYDSLTVTTPASPTPPTICGYNTGQHMYIPASPYCNTITINLDLNKSFTRKWRIRVTQYDPGHSKASSLPPPGCLQWHTGVGPLDIHNFNYEDTSSFHLSSQRYSICWRRERGYCSLCLSQGIFGISNVPSLAPSSSTTSWNKKAGNTDSICCSVDSPTANCATSGADDYIELLNSRDSAASDPFRNGDCSRYCGRYIACATATVTYGAAAVSTICTANTPFRLRVNFSPGEKLSSTSANVCSTSAPAARTGDTTDECGSFRTYGSRRGTMGFKLAAWQVACT